MYHASNGAFCGLIVAFFGFSLAYINLPQDPVEGLVCLLFGGLGAYQAIECIKDIF